MQVKCLPGTCMLKSPASFSIMHVEHSHTDTHSLTVLTCPLPAACVFQKVQLDV